MYKLFLLGLVLSCCAVTCIIYAVQPTPLVPLKLTIIPTYGENGVTKDGSYTPGETIAVRIRIDNVMITKDEGKTIYVESTLTNAKGELHQFAKGFLLNRASQKGCATDHVYSRCVIPIETSPGDYYFKATMHADGTKKFDAIGKAKISIVENKAMKLNNPRLCFDNTGGWPSSGIFVPGQTIFYYSELENAISLNGKVVASARTIIENEQKEIVRDNVYPIEQDMLTNTYPLVIPISISTTIAKEGNYTLKFTVTDKNSPQEASYSIPFRVVSRMDGS